MKKILTVTLMFLAGFTQANAYNGGEQYTFKPNIQMKELENKVHYSYLEEQYNIKKAYSEGLTKCADKNMYYLPSHGSADSDGCYDVLSYINSIALDGSESVAVIETAFAGSDDAEGVFLADYKCNEASAGTRAMRYGDIKYIMKNNSLLTDSSYYHIFEGVNDITNIDNKALVTGEFMQDLAGSLNVSCTDYTSTSSSVKSVRLKSDVAAAPKIVTSACSSAAKILCVRD